jgi:hypothetical protein
VAVPAFRGSGRATDRPEQEKGNRTPGAGLLCPQKRSRISIWIYGGTKVAGFFFLIAVLVFAVWATTPGEM